jgi:hypothetical protein
LRVHVTARIADRCGSVLGLRVQSLGALVEELLAGDALAPRDGEFLFPLLVRRVSEALEGRGMREDLARFEDGYGALQPTIADLLDAGFHPEHFDACAERLANFGRADADAAPALLQVALGVRAAFASLGLAHRSDRIERALSILEAKPESLPARGVVLYGFADATGTQANLLLGLMRHAEARAIVDDPRPGVPEVAHFAAPLRARMAGIAGAREADPAPRNTVVSIEAEKPSGELRATVHAVARELAAGVAPEGIAIVARDLDPYRVSLCRALERAGIPFSGAPGALARSGPWRRRIRALRDLLAEGSRARLFTWLAAREAPADLVRALVPWSGNRLCDLPDEPPRLASAGAGLWRDACAFSQAAARAVDRFAWDGWVGLILSALGPEREGRDEPQPAVRHRLEELRRELPEGLSLGPEDFALLFAGVSEDLGACPLGGAGGGVRLLSVTEARGLTFARLFVLGMNRELFPRPIREDAFLSDPLRRGLSPLLPDLPIKERGHDEERYLAAQLAEAAERVTLSWSAFDEEGRPNPRSPLLELLQPPPADAVEPPNAEAVDARAVAGPAIPARHRDALIVAFEAAARELGVEVSGEHVAAHVVRGAEQSFGRVPPPPTPEEPLYVTGLEGLLRCPWRYYIGRVLDAQPQERSPGVLPSFDPRVIGNCVHRALEAAGARAGLPTREAFGALAGAPATEFAWPDAKALDAILLEAAETSARDAGVFLPGFARALAARARPHLTRIREVDTAAGNHPWLGVEVAGHALVPEAPGGRIRFRADRVEKTDDGLLLTDVKTGGKLRPPALQALAYALADGPTVAAGRYLMSRPESPPERASSAVDARDPAVRERLAAAAAAGDALWRDGVFFPRLTKPDGREPDACRTCDVAAACVRAGDRERRALIAFAEERGGDTAEKGWRSAWEIPQ